MNNNLKKVCGILFAAIGLTAEAQDYNYLTVDCQNTEKSIELNNIRKITFNEQDAIVWIETGESIHFPLSELSAMKFTANPTALESLKAESKSLKYKSGKLYVGNKGTLRIYNADGILVNIAHITEEQTEVNLDGLAPGLYIMGLGKENIKIRK